MTATHSCYSTLVRFVVGSVSSCSSLFTDDPASRIAFTRYIDVGDRPLGHHDWRGSREDSAANDAYPIVVVPTTRWHPTNTPTYTARDLAHGSA
jgi:hypothetical protein